MGKSKTPRAIVRLEQYVKFLNGIGMYSDEELKALQQKMNSYNKAKQK